VKNQEEHGMLIFFSDEKNLDQDQMVNRRNDRLLCAVPSNDSRVMHIKLPATEKGVRNDDWQGMCHASPLLSAMSSRYFCCLH